MNKKPYIITYDLKNTDKNYSGLFKLIKDVSDDVWMHYLESVWIITSIKTADEIFDKLKTAIDENDYIFITEITKYNHQGWLPKKAWDYFNDNIII